MLTQTSELERLESFSDVHRQIVRFLGLKVFMGVTAPLGITFLLSGGQPSLRQIYVQNLFKKCFICMTSK